MDNSIHSDLIRGHINTIILKALFEGDKYGYEICKEISERTMGQYTLKQPTLYSCLKRMEKQGFIKSYWSVGVTGGGRRKYYTLTELGKDIYLKSQAEWEFSRTVIDNLISDKQYDLQIMPPKTAESAEKKIAKPTVIAMQDFNEGDDVNFEDEEEIDEIEEPKKEQQKTPQIAEEYIQEENPQFNLFENIGVNVDKRIEDFEKVARIYDEVNIRKTKSQGEEPVDSEQDELLDMDDSSLTSYKTKLDIIEESSKAQVGFDANSSKFMQVSPPSYTDSILNEEIKSEQSTFAVVKKIEEQPPRRTVAERPVIEYIETETTAEKEYRVILKKLLALTKNSTVSDTTPQTTKQENQQPAEKVSVPLQPTQSTEDFTISDDSSKILQYKPKGNVDFSDLQSKMQAEGFKIRTRESSKQQVDTTAYGYVRLAPLLLSTTIIIFCIAVAELLIMYFVIPAFALELKLLITLLAISLLIPLIGACCAAYYKKKKVYDRFKFSYSFLLALIVAISIFMVCASIAFFTGSDLSVTSVVLQFIALPAVLAINIPLAVTIFALLKSKQKK